MKSFAGIVLLASALGLATTPIAFAADQPDVPLGDASIAYSLLHDQPLSTNYPRGWAVSIAGGLNSWFAVVGEVNGNYKQIVPGPEGITFPYSILTHTVTGGGRVTARPTARIAVFGQLLCGWARLTTTSTGVYGNTNGAVNGFALQPGGGIDFNIDRRIGIRVQGDFRRIRADGANRNQSRLLTGVVLRFSR